MHNIIGIIILFAIFGSIIFVGVRGYKYSIDTNQSKIIALRKAVNWGGFTFIVIFLELLILKKIDIFPVITIAIATPLIAFALARWLPKYSDEKSEATINATKGFGAHGKYQNDKSLAENADDKYKDALIKENIDEYQDDGLMLPSELYATAIKELRSEHIPQAKTNFNRLIESFSDTEEAFKAKLHLAKILKPKSNIPTFIYILPLFIGYILRKQPDILAQSIEALLFGTAIMVVWWAWLSWKNYAIDDAEQKVKNASMWIGFVAVFEIVVGLLIKFGAFKPPYSVDSDYAILIGVGFLIIAPVVFLSRNVLTVFALLFAIAGWGKDTLLIIWGIIVTNFDVGLPDYISLVVHIIILYVFLGALGGLNGIFKLRSYKATQSNISNAA